MRPIVSEVFDRADTAPDTLAVAYNGKSITYGDMAIKIGIGASVLQDYGVSKGDRVILLASSALDFILAYFSAHALGAVAVPIDPQLNDDHLRYVVDEVEPALILSNRELGDHLTNVEPISVIDMEGSSLHVPLQTRIDAPADILFTTGTTGTPKGVVLTQRNITAAARNINEFIGNDSLDRELVPLPLSHSFGLGRLRCNMLAGGMIILAEGFMLPGKLFEALDYWKATGFSFVPAGLSLLYRFSGDKLREYSDQLKYVEIGSSPMPLEHKVRLMELLPNTRICMHYGLTEASRAAFIEMHESDHQLGSVGKPSPNVQIRVIDDDARELPHGEPGQIIVQGEMVMRNYWQNSELTNESLVDGWLYTGDVGYKNASGYLYLTGRKSDLINIGGLKVSPVEIEGFLNSMGGIEESACVGVPDPLGFTGEAVKAVLVANDPDSFSRPTETQIINYLRKKIEPYKIPKVFEWVGSIPKTRTGKIQRRLLEPSDNE